MEARARLLAELPVAERHDTFAGVPTTFLEGGQGPPVILLHGPGESALWWLRVLPGLVGAHRVIVPDLPGHGASGMPAGALDDEVLHDWLDALLDATVAEPPVLIGHILGGAIAARYAARRSRRLGGLVLVDTLGLRRFRPAPGFAFGLVRFLARPNARNYDRFLGHCMMQPERLAIEMGHLWPPFLEYTLQKARDPVQRRAMRALMGTFGVPRIPPAELQRLGAGTALIWGRGDRATPVSVAEAASARYGWRLQVIEDARDDPKLERPAAFLEALAALLPRPLVPHAVHA